MWGFVFFISVLPAAIPLYIDELKSLSGLTQPFTLLLVGIVYVFVHFLNQKLILQLVDIKVHFLSVIHFSCFEQVSLSYIECILYNCHYLA